MNGVSIVKVFENALWTALRTIFWPKCTRLQDFAYTVSTFLILRTLAEALPVLGPRHQILLGSPAFPLFLFYETTTAALALACSLQACLLGIALSLSLSLFLSLSVF